MFLYYLSASLLLIILLSEPWVLFDLVYGGPVTRFVCQHSHDEVAELVGEVLSLNLFEILVGLTIHYQIEEIFVLSRFLEREYSSDNDK